MRRLYIGPSCDVARMESVCGFRRGRDYAYRVRLDSRRHALGRAPVIRRSIWSDLLYCPGLATGHMYIPELLCLYLYGEVVWTGVRLELSFCPGHVVLYQVRQPQYAWVVWAPTSRRRIGVETCASGNSFLVARGRILQLPGH